MPPLFASFPVERVTQVFNAHGIHAIQTFPDGQTIWGDQPLLNGKYNGRFFPGDMYVPGRYSIYTVRAIIGRLVDTAAERDAIEDELFNYGSEGLGVEGQ